MVLGMANRVELTLSDELLGRVDVARGFEPRASFVKRLLERELPAASVESVVELQEQSNALRERRVENAREVVELARSTVGSSSFSCPISGCDFSAPSAKARCPRHGRSVK